jgi:hypothetical protein
VNADAEKCAPCRRELAANSHARGIKPTSFPELRLELQRQAFSSGDYSTHRRAEQSGTGFISARIAFPSSGGFRRTGSGVVGGHLDAHVGGLVPAIAHAARIPECVDGAQVEEEHPVADQRAKPVK